MASPPALALRIRGALRGSTVAIALLLLGCNSLVAHGGLDPEINPQFGNLYPGVRLNLKTWHCLPETTSAYPPVASVFLVPISVALLVVDLPISAVSDTLLLPIDLIVKPDSKAIDWQKDPCGEPG